MSATEKFLRGGLVLLCLGFVGELIPPLHAASSALPSPFQPGLEKSEISSLVRVVARTRISGLLHEEDRFRFISQSTVVQISDFTGVLLDRDGYVAAYVGSSWTQAQGLDPEFAVQFYGGEEMPARLVGVDERVSVAILQVGKKNGAPAVMASPRRTGDAYLVSGSEAGWRDVRIDVSEVRSTELETEIELQVRLRDRATGELPGTGNVALDASGRFLGFVTQLDRKTLGWTPYSLRLLPAGIVRDSLDAVVSSKANIEAGWLGIFMDSGTRKVQVSRVVPDSPAQQAGLEEGDLILKAGDTNVWSKSQFVKLVRWAGPGEELGFTVERKGKVIRLPVRLSGLPESRQTNFTWALKVPRVIGPKEELPPGEREFQVTLVPLDSSIDLGFSVYPLTPQLAQHFKSPTGRGLLVKSILEGSPAEGFGFTAGDILLRINDEVLQSKEDLSRALTSRSDGTLEIEWLRDGRVQKRRLVLH